LYGTPFDLSQMQGISGLDVNHIKQVKVIDVVGNIGQYATYDKNNNKVNDPWPTPFASCGFDLDAVGVINEQTAGINRVTAGNNNQVTVYPNPASNSLHVSFLGNNVQNQSLVITDMLGNTVKQLITYNSSFIINVTDLENGVYFIQLNGNGGNATKKIIISK